MNPLASQFSPSSFAVVPYGGPVKANRAEAHPKDLIMHESIKTLVHEVQELRVEMHDVKTRAIILEQENGHLKLQMTALKQLQRHDTGAPAVQGNISGYAVSDVSSTDFTAATNDTTAVEKKVIEHQDTVTKILEKFNEHLSSGATKQEELGKQFTEIQGVLKNVKGRTGVLESKFKTIAVDVSELEMDVQKTRNEKGSMAATTNTKNAGLPKFVHDRIEKLQAGLKTVEADVDTHRALLNELGQNDRDKWVNGGIQSGWNASNLDTAEWAVSSSPLISESWALGNDSKLGKDDKLKVVEQLKALMTDFYKFKEKYRRIDDCATKDALYELYHGYTKEIDDATGDKLDELCDLRDWVVVRLALFDAYGKALREAKTADIGL